MAAKHDVHRTLIVAWKRQAVDGLATTFSGAGETTKSTSDAELEELYAKNELISSGLYLLAIAKLLHGPK